MAERRTIVKPSRLTYIGRGQPVSIPGCSVSRNVINPQPVTVETTGSVISKKSSRTPTTVISYNSQLKQLDIEMRMKLNENKEKFELTLAPLRRELVKLEKTVEVTEKARKERFPLPIQEETDPAVKEEHQKSYEVLTELKEEHSKVLDNYNAAYEDYDRTSDFIIKKYELMKESVVVLRDEEQEQLLGSDEEERVTEWNKVHQYDQSLPFDLQYIDQDPESIDLGNGNSQQQQHMNEHENMTIFVPDRKVNHRQQGQLQFEPRREIYYPQHGPQADNLHQPDRQARQRLNQRSNGGTEDFVNQLTTALGRAFGSHGGMSDLPQFGAKAEDWPVFEAEYKRTKDNFQPSQNVSRLRKALKGPAREAVVGLLDDPGSVTKILSTLANRFGRSEFIIDSLILKVRECKAPDINKPESVVHYGTLVQHLVIRVKSLNKMSYLYNTTLLQELVRKLPTVMAEQWITYLDDHLITDANLAHFGHWMEEKMNRMIRLCKPTVTEPQTEEKTKARVKRGSVSINVTTSEDKQDSSSPCEFCGRNNHASVKCWKFKKITVDDRWNMVREKKLCFSCLQSDHVSNACKAAKECEMDGCKRKHHRMLHYEKKGNFTSAPNEIVKVNMHEKEDNFIRFPDTDVVVPGTIKAMIQPKLSSKPLSIVAVRIRGPTCSRKTYALMDSGANVTVIDEKLALEVGLQGKPFTHHYKGVGGSAFTENAMKVAFDIAGEYKGARMYPVTEAVTVKDLGLDSYSLDVAEAKKKFPYLRRAKLKNISNGVPKIIIGEDYPHLTAHREIVERCDSEPMAKRTKLGWVLAGKNLSSQGSGNINVFTEYNTDVLDSMMKESFSLASFGVVPFETKGSLQDRRALDILDKTTKKIDNHWECGLIWSDDDVKLPSSKDEAMARLIQNERRMRKDKNYAEMYHRKIDEYMEKGYIRKLNQMEGAVQQDRTWYIPHFGVLSANKPGKLRLVFDAASKSSGICLNDKLLKGPDLIRSLVSVLWNFRTHNIAITGDIEDMFHRVGIRTDDQDSQRFLWRSLSEADKKKSPDTYVMTVMIFGASASPCSAIYVKNTNAETFYAEYPEAAHATVQDFYVDDCLSGAPSPEKAIKLLNEITYVNAQGGFNVKKWLSNSPEVLEAIPAELRAAGVKDFGLKSIIPQERVLGLWWDPGQDAFTFKVNFHKVDDEILEGRIPTKREMCSLVMSVYDPLGFVNTLKIQGMILLQQTWRVGISWDDDIPEDIYNEWKIWLDNLKKIENVRVPRLYCYDVHLADNVQLHTFVDASDEAFAAVSYLRIQQDDKITVSFVSSKVRVAPMKKLTIPRLELLAAVLGARLAATILAELKLNIHSKHYWSDSRTVLLWLKSETLRLREFVANRVGELQEITNVTEWRWVPTALNIADEATRLKKPIVLNENSTWLNGPPFLKDDPSTWPCETQTNFSTDEFENELRNSTIGVTSSLPDMLEPGELDLSKVAVTLNRFSSYFRLCRAQAGVLAAAKYWKVKTLEKDEKAEAPWTLPDGVVIPKKKMKKFLQQSLKSNLTIEDLQTAELLMVKKVQREAFIEDLNDLKQSGKVRKQSNLLKLSPFLDTDGVMRVEGRMKAADYLPMDFRQPIILPSRHVYTELLIIQEHVLNAHQGQATVLNTLRQKYWIIDGRAAVRRVCNLCQDCFLRKAKPIIPKLGNLPHYRLSAGDPPFTHTGVDFFGPLEVTVGRHHEKRWGAIFTCMVTRAIHLEVAYGLSTDEMMLVLSRFVDCRGRPRYMHSDNGTNFVGTNNELKQVWNSIDWNFVKTSEKLQPITWSFLPSFSPHMAGAWARMVQSTKKVLRKTLMEKYPKDQVLITVMKGAENIINSRPLTYVSGDPTDEESLTPNHFLRGAYFVGPSIPGTYEVRDEILRKNWRRAQVLLDHFWRRWTKEYLPELNKRMKWHASSEPLQCGDIVLLVDEQMPRNCWVKAEITSTFPGSDGQVRVVDVTTREFGSTKTRTYRRSVDKVIPLGLRI